MSKVINWKNKVGLILLLLIICIIGIGKIILNNRDIKSISKENLNKLITKDYNIESLVIEGQDIKLNILGNLELKEAKNISRKIYNKIPKESIKDGEIVLNFFEKEKECKEKVNYFYKDGMTYKININCETEEMIVNSFSKTKVKLSDINIDLEELNSDNKKKLRTVNVFGESGESILENSEDLDQVIEKLNY